MPIAELTLGLHRKTPATLVEAVELDQPLSRGECSVRITFCEARGREPFEQFGLDCLQALK